MIILVFRSLYLEKQNQLPVIECIRLKKIKRKPKVKKEMLPNSTSSIYINPRFRNVHINPNFLSKSSSINGKASELTTVTAPTQIYINPRFLGNSSIQGIAMTQPTNSAPSVIHSKETFTQLTAQEFHESNFLVAEPLADTKIHTRTKIINLYNKPKIGNPPKTEQTTLMTTNTSKSLIKIGSKKLVRVSAKPKPFEKSTKTITKLRRPLQTKYKIVKEQTAFKIDRRSAKAKLKSISCKIAPIVPSRKLWINESLMPTKMIKWYDSIQK